MGNANGVNREEPERALDPWLGMVWGASGVVLFAMGFLSNRGGWWLPFGFLVCVAYVLTSGWLFIRYLAMRRTSRRDKSSEEAMEEAVEEAVKRIGEKTPPRPLS